MTQWMDCKRQRQLLQWCQVRVELRDDTGKFTISAASDDIDDDDDEGDASYNGIYVQSAFVRNIISVFVFC